MTVLAKLRQRLLVFLAAVLLLVGGGARAATERTPPGARHILALYSSELTPSLRQSQLHDIAQLPLNHLGLHVTFHDVTKGLPPLEMVRRARGVLTWFGNNEDIPDPEGYAEWLTQVAETGTRLAILGHPGFTPGNLEIAAHRNVLSEFGLDWTGNYVGVTFDTRVIQQRHTMMGFEETLPGLLPPFTVVKPANDAARSHLVVETGNGQRSHLVITTPQGGFASDGYELRQEEDDQGVRIRRWLIDPFQFFAEAFATDGLPAPDITTRAGRRIYYSHIDGDGWLNPTLIEEYQNKGEPLLSSEVILKDAMRAFPELPVTAAPVGGDLSLDWHGTRDSRRVAREIFQEPQVEAGNHTMSHPFAWGFFEKSDHRAREKPFFSRYPGSERLVGALGRVRKLLGFDDEDSGFTDAEIYGNYERPRAYALEPFSLPLEIDESRRVIAGLLPEGKTVATYQWSGNTAPFENMLAAVNASEMANINGGDSRYDPEYPSYAWAAPYGIQIGEAWQVFASNSNENTYTENWTNRYFGFKYLKSTLDNTERPVRVAPFNVYYHMYSGERRASLDALISNLELARAAPVIPVETSLFARIGQGFRSTRLERLGPGRWAVEDRGALNTLRFDHAVFRAVDFERSHGVLGQRRLHGKLYVALDPEVTSPIVAIAEEAPPHGVPPAPRAYLIESAWDVRGLQLGAAPRTSFRATVRGYADGHMRWAVAPDTHYRMTLKADGELVASQVVRSDARGVLDITLARLVPGPWPKGPVTLSVKMAVTE